jgi:proline racemase
LNLHRGHCQVPWTQAIGVGHRQHSSCSAIVPSLGSGADERAPLAEAIWSLAMRARRAITVIGCHAGGEIGNVVVAGVPPPDGATVFEQMQALEADDGLRRFLLREPRGSVAAHANLLVPSTRPDCEWGYIIMEPTEYPAMSGSNTICVATVLLEGGFVEMTEPETVLRLEAPGGIVEVRAACRDGRVESVELVNVPSFVAHLDAPLEVAGLGTLVVDVAYGGMWYAIADAEVLGFAIEPHEARDLSAAGELIRKAAREQLPCVHPERPAIAGVSIVQIAQPWQGVEMTHASALGTTFDGRIVAIADVAGTPAIVPAIRGSAWITGTAELYIDPDDPFPEGYLLTDTWPGSDVQ